MRGAEAVVRLLEEHGVQVVFGLCGDTSLPLYAALAESGIEHVLTRDERGASFMADAYGRLSGRVGVCEGPSGGGATYILPGVAEANESSVPVLCFTTDISVTDRGKGTLTELDQPGLFRPVTKRTFAPEHAREIEASVRDAFREATTGSLGACHVALPLDVQDQDVALGPPGDADAAPGDGYPRERLAPDPDDVARAARLLADSRRPLIVAGAGALRSGAWDEVRALSRALGAPVATSICGKGIVAETDPYALGVIGSNGGLPYRHDIVRDADLVLYVGNGTGSVTTEKWTLPEPGAVPVIQLDTNAGVLGRNYPLAAGLLCDARTGVGALAEAVAGLGAGGGGEGDRWDPDELERARAGHMESVAHLFASEERPIPPERLLAALFRSLPDDAVVLADPGTPCPYLSAYWRITRAGRCFVSPRAFGALGYALPGVLGAQRARPDAGRVVGVMGDGSFGISVGELETLVRLAVPATLVVCNNAGYGWIKAGQKSRGDRYYSVDFGRADHAAIARAFGMPARRVEDPAELDEAVAEALAAEGPYLLDVLTQPLEAANAPVSKWIA